MREGEARTVAEAALARLPHAEDLADVAGLRGGRGGGMHQGSQIGQKYHVKTSQNEFFPVPTKTGNEV